MGCLFLEVLCVVFDLFGKLDLLLVDHLFVFGVEGEHVLVVDGMEMLHLGGE